ncbi:hypothetical protein CAC42_6096 [Sphaceloma murrayae]|uniref:Ribosomal RNA-processing protein 1 n=1 Tax=Sphaceloma murrayae TaxID=2082308 RepID=A0A2K1QVC3_9PEZI|nr:hypothetical protein CAC42_6096 [Sphaceloma murrayae]
MASTSTPSVPAQGTLLQSLTSSSLARRTAAFAQLRTYLLSKRNFTSLDYLKLWKGLFYCLYMTPKPLRQQRLSLEIAGLVGDVVISELGQGDQEDGKDKGEGKGKKRGRGEKEESGVGRGGKRRRVVGDQGEDVEEGEQDGKFLGFVRGFWVTMGREWEGIDKARLDKFLFLVRRMVFVGFEGCKVPSGSDVEGTRTSKEEAASAEEDEDDTEDYDWDEDRLGSYLSILSDLPLNAKDLKTIGLKLHVIDVLVDEMERADPAGKLDLEKALQPLRALVKESPTKTVRTRAKEALDDDRLKAWGSEPAAEEPNGNEEDSSDQEAQGDDEEFGGFDD